MTKNHHFWQTPRKLASAVFLGTFALTLAVAACTQENVVKVSAVAVTGTQQDQEIESFYFPMIENKTEYVAPELPIHYDLPRSYDLDEADVKLLARLLWSSPLREERQKKALAWVVINRIGVSPYGDTLSAVINKTEFTFLDRKAHVSEENKRIATEALNAYYSIKAGLNIKRPFSASGVKIQFVGDPARYIRVLDKDFNVVWDGTER